MRDDSRAANCSTMMGNDTAPKRVGEDPWSWRRRRFGGPFKAPDAEARGADPAVDELRAPGAAWPEGWLTLERFHCFSF